MAREYDVVVIGAGSAGAKVASSCRQAGLNTAIVEARDFGGTCPNRGCNPKKVLVNAAAAVARTADLCGKGINAAASLNWRDLIRFKRSLVEPRPPQIEGKLRRLGVHTFYGQARFVGKKSLRVGEDVLNSKYIFISTGMVPRKLGFPGEEYVTTSEQFMESESLPEVITFIGGGYISFEFAHV
ncbi:MAG TPA: FAD-dependent oxidoreductase, partial [Desulfobaccales bacterium]|nr:FAD-dependent oxidoreductase [Desulfobaccales bacterium]